MPTAPEPLLAMENIDKAFGGVPALSGASLTVNEGEVRALIGQNGAGKSTMIKVLTGVHRKDAGQTRFAGRVVEFDSPSAAQKGGIATIYQEVNLVPYRTLAENIFLGQEKRRFKLLDWRAMNTAAEELLGGLDLDVDVTRPLQEYPIATQQMTAIARALSFNARLVIMDEPTSSLAQAEVQTLFDVIRRLRSDGISVLFVSHRLDELYAVCDRVTVMRDGCTVADRAMSEISKYELVSTMIGRDLSQARAEATRPPHDPSGTPVIVADGLRRPPVVNGVHLTVRAGEIVGLAGLLGSGRSETARVLFGADRAQGTVAVHGKPVTLTSPRDAIRNKIGFLPEDRKAEGIIPGMSVRENLTLAALPNLTKAGRVDTKRQDAIVEEFVAALAIKCAGPDQPIKELSGGNQQKVLLARWLCTEPDLLIIDEPTRGIDVGAKREIQLLVRKLADEGLAVLLISSEIEELLETADRVVVLRDGAAVADLRGDQLTEKSILEAMASGAATHDERVAGHA